VAKKDMLSKRGLEVGGRGTNGMAVSAGGPGGARTVKDKNFNGGRGGHAQGNWGDSEATEGWRNIDTQRAVGGGVF